MKSGIYAITNKINGMKYIGSAVDIKSRWSGHRSMLNKNIHGNKPLQHAWNKYGSSSFDFNVLRYVFRECLLICEQVEFQKYDFKKDLYNTNTIACGIQRYPRLGVCKGVKHPPRTEEYRRLLSNALKGRKRPPRSIDWCQKISKSKIGIKRGAHSEETKIKISNAKIGRKLTAEQYSVLSIANKRRSKILPDHIPEILKLHSEGLNCRQIAILYNVCTETIRSRIVNHNT